MFYKFLKFLFLSTLTLTWGCSENKDHVAATYGCYASKCYNTTAKNDSGRVFDIIECESGDKFLRFPGLYNEIPELRKNLPKGVEINAPIANANDCGAINCKYEEADICIDGVTRDENGNEKNVGGCYPVINCPEKE